MDRREFLKLAAISGIGFSISNSIDKIINTIEAYEKIDLAVVHGPSPSLITKAAINAIGGIKKFVSRGDIVVLKPNIGFDRLPEHAANTNPEVVSTVVRLCYEAGAKKVKVFDRTVNDPRRCYVQSGIADAARASGAEVKYVDERKFRDMDIKGQVIKTWPLYTEIFEADKVINIPIAKNHGLAKLTMAMKNLMGIMGGTRNKIHQRLDECLVDLSMFVKPALTILDAVRILTANGPSGGDIRDVKKLDTVVVGTDPVAVDSFGATLFGMKGSDLGYVRIADKLGLGTMDLSRLKIKTINI